MLTLPWISRVFEDVERGGWYGFLWSFGNNQNGLRRSVPAKEVYEVDRYDKFHQGIGQTLHYSMVLKKPAVLALMLDKAKIDPAKTAFIEKLCKHYKIRLVLLKAEN